MQIKWNRHVIILYDENGDFNVAAALKDHIEKEFDPCDVVMINSEAYSVGIPYKIGRLMKKVKARHFRGFLTAESKRREKFEAKRVQELLRTNGYSAQASKARKIEVYRILNIIKRFDPVMVMCTTSEALKLTLICKDILGKTFRTVGVVSDFALDASFVRAEADGYFVENPDVKTKLMNCGVVEERIAVVGYPTVLYDVYKNKEQKRASLGLTSDLPLVVVNGGEYDTYTLKKDIIKLMEKKDDYILMIITKDKKLRKFYMDLPEFSAGVLINEELSSDVFDVADILVTIPDTGAIFNAFMRGIAVIVADGVTVLEDKIKDYLVKRALVTPTRTPEETLFGVYEMLDEPLRRNEFKYRGEVYVRLSVNDIRNITPQIGFDGVQKLTNKQQ